jgi:hypothetical protein
MKPIVSSLALAATLGLAHVAMAQQAANDVDYCRTLARTYLGQNPVQSSPNVADATLADSCTTNAAGTIATLKQKITSHGIDLPKPTMAGAGQ